MTTTVSSVMLNLYHIFCVYPERIYHTLSENEHFASFSFFMPEHGKGGLFFNAPDGHSNRKKENTMAKNTEFAGKTIVATGKLENFTRAEINDKILEIGAKPGSSVTGKTDYLVCGEKAGSKLAKAKSLGITILSEAEFLAKIS